MKFTGKGRCVIIWAACMLPWLLCGGLAAAQPAINLKTLLDEMTDLERLAVLPEFAYSTRQFSSYDRRATDPTELTDENWFANADTGQFLRTEETERGTEHVVMEADGPGAIVRIWSANADGADTIRFYFDGEENPSIEMPFEDMMRGDVEPFIAPIVGVRAMGWNNYLPIPYAESVKVTADDTPFYYLINYRSYEDDAAVETFTLDAALDALPQIRRVAEALATPKATAEQAIDAHPTMQYGRSFAPGEAHAFDPIEGPAALYRLTARVEAADVPAALRALLLEITFDGHDSPAVMTPLGDFFGTAPGENPYESLSAGFTEKDGFYAHWVMPFAEQAVVRIHNTGDQDVTLRGQWTAGPWDWDENSLYFHAKWRQEWQIDTRPRQDWNYGTFEGQGRYVGNMLAIANPTPAWWGEGDEKIYVDGEDFPSHFGTGTEDYYGYAWCSPELFTHAYHNQSRCDGPVNYGHTSVNRFHIMDDIPYTESLRFDMEVWHWEEVIIDQAVINYWYARNNADNFTAIAPEALIVPEIPEHSIARVEGALEGEDMRVIAASAGNARTQTSFAWEWSGGEQIWWTDADVGDTLELGFEVAEAGRYRIHPSFTHAVDYGIVSLEINGQPVAESIDLYAEQVSNPDMEPLGVFDLESGENILKVTIEGHHPDAVPGHMFGLDYLLLEAAE